MGKKLDLTGRTFGRLTVIAEAPKHRRGRVHWRCRCTCGNEVVVDGTSLRRGATQSCGCLWAERQRARVDHHGGAGTPEYAAWRHMRRKCVDPTHPQFAAFGARGVRVCARWSGEGGFVNFLEDLGPRPAGHVLGLVNVDGDFEPGNCRWMTRRELPRAPRVEGECRLRGTAAPEYHALYGAVRRCTDPANPHFANYGGRGIHVCLRWLGPDGFTNFLEDMGPRPGAGWSLDRIDDDGDYCPTNCRWATNAQQQNNKRTSVQVVLDGEVHTLAEWARVLGVPVKRITARVAEHPEWPAARQLFPGRLYGLTAAQLAQVDSGAWRTGGEA